MADSKSGWAGAVTEFLNKARDHVLERRLSLKIQREYPPDAEIH
jgi:hypothetical protein